MSQQQQQTPLSRDAAMADGSYSTSARRRGVAAAQRSRTQRWHLVAAVHESSYAQYERKRGRSSRLAIGSARRSARRVRGMPAARR